MSVLWPGDARNALLPNAETSQPAAPEHSRSGPLGWDFSKTEAVDIIECARDVLLQGPDAHSYQPPGPVTVCENVKALWQR